MDNLQQVVTLLTAVGGGLVAVLGSVVAIIKARGEAKQAMHDTEARLRKELYEQLSLTNNRLDRANERISKLETDLAAERYLHQTLRLQVRTCGMSGCPMRERIENASS